ncbi:MAG: tetratricopeptide repeat protein [Leptospiraceae bacterium]|nr:tetratricopeptide repeat protein [Leptospiraceae bacterium]MDW8306001.1 tetratricopeptide repeat protein [Leptospiraceae bacterium]
MKKSPYLDEGEKAYARGAYDKALEAFERAIEEGDETGRAYFFTGQILEARKKYREAISYYAQAVDKSLEKNYKITTLWKLVLLNKEFGNYEDALRYLDRLVSAGVKHENLEKLRQEMELLLSPQKKEALSLMQEIETREKELAPFRKSPHFYRDFREELLHIAQLAERVFNLDSSQGAVLSKAALYYERTGHVEEALKLYHRLTFVKGESARAWYKIGTLERKKGAFGEALVAFEKVVFDSKDKSSHMQYYLHLQKSQCYYALGKYDMALKESLIAHRMKPKESFAELFSCLISKKIHPPSDFLCTAKKPGAASDTLEKTIYYLYVFEEAKSEGDREKGGQALRQAFLGQEFGRTEEEVFPRYLEQDLHTAFDFFWLTKDYLALTQLYERYSFALENEVFVKRIALAYAEIQKYERVYELLKKHPFRWRNWESLWEKTLLELGYFAELKNHLWETYAGEEKKAILEQKLEEERFAKFRESSEGRELLQKLAAKEGKP